MKGRLQTQMTLFFSNKAVRLLLSISVSIWMAGACLLGCSNSTMATESGESCHAMAQQPADVSSFAPTPHDMMKDCPLIANATAATSKNTTHLPDPGRVSAAVLPRFEKQTRPVSNTLVVPLVHNRDPSLLCCVFLI